jgi:isopentenyldiphosphate isomerase
MPWTSDFHIDDSTNPKRIQLLANSPDGANKAIANLLHIARKKELFKCLNGWRNEEYRILGATSDVKVERAGAGLFGITTTGVHMTVYTRSVDGEILLWVPKRSMTTKKNPGKLDSSVAGGVPAGIEPFECLVKEAAEEASLQQELTRRCAKAAGCVMEYNIEEGGEGLLEPSLKYVYDMEIDRKTVLQPADTEVEEFRLMTAMEVKANILAGHYKPMCVMVLIDFLIRHGILTIENEKDYPELVARTHRYLPFPLRNE